MWADWKDDQEELYRHVMTYFIYGELINNLSELLFN